MRATTCGDRTANYLESLGEGGQGLNDAAGDGIAGDDGDGLGDGLHAFSGDGVGDGSTDDGDSGDGG